MIRLKSLWVALASLSMTIVITSLIAIADFAPAWLLIASLPLVPLGGILFGAFMSAWRENRGNPAAIDQAAFSKFLSFGWPTLVSVGGSTLLGLFFTRDLPIRDLMQLTWGGVFTNVITLSQGVSSEQREELKPLPSWIAGVYMMLIVLAASIILLSSLFLVAGLLELVSGMSWSWVDLGAKAVRGWTANGYNGVFGLVVGLLAFRKVYGHFPRTWKDWRSAAGKGAEVVGVIVVFSLAANQLSYVLADPVTASLLNRGVAPILASFGRDALTRAIGYLGTGSGLALITLLGTRRFSEPS